ncbi:MAG: HEAT repeat domain-containing protein [Myxococcota bacterium]
MSVGRPDANPELLAALERVRAEDEATREAATEKVGELIKGDATVADVMAVIETASSEDLPPAKFKWQSSDGNLLRTVWGKTTDDHVPVVVRRFDNFTKAGRTDALALLAQTETKTATEAYVAVLRRYGWPEQSWPAMTAAYDQKALYPEVVLPALLDGSIKDLPDDAIDHFLLGYGEAGKLPKSTQDAARARTAKRAQELVSALAPMQRTNGIAWRWDDDYAQPRLEAGLVLDVLGHLGRSPAVLAALREAEKLQDPRVKMFAVLSLLKLGEAPSSQSLQDVAEDAQSRGHLFRVLEARGALDLMPASQRTQEKLAEADMVSWLTYPTELARAPDEIELRETVEVDAGKDGGGVFVYYVFRFRTRKPHWAAKDGWMAGISGPFRKAEMPTMTGWGDTFSTFTKWEEFDVSEHLSSIRQLMQTWREHHDRL